jgi:Septum formation
MLWRYTSMKALRFGRAPGTIAMLAVTVGALVSMRVAPAAAATADRTTPANPERWMRSVCRDVSSWFDATDKSEGRITDAVESLKNSDGTPKPTKTRLVNATASGARASDELITSVRSAGVPKLADGKQVAGAYLEVITGYRDAYEQARKAYEHTSTRDKQQFLAAVEAIEANRAADLQEVGFDPLDELRSVPELAAAIDTQTTCGDVESYLNTALPGAPVAVGDCVAEVTENEFDLKKADCAGAHGGEVFAVTEHPAKRGEAFPGNQSVDDYANQTCDSAFAAYVGIDFDSSQFDVTYWSPTGDTWSTGDREFICVLQDPDNSALVGSVKGTAR